MIDNKIKKIGHMVKTTRKAQGLTQQQLAALSHSSYCFY